MLRAVIQLSAPPVEPEVNEKSTERTSPAAVSQKDIQQLVSYGFSEEDCRQALDTCRGDVNEAASLLFNKDMGVEPGDIPSSMADLSAAVNQPKASATDGSAVFLNDAVVVPHSPAGFQLQLACIAVGVRKLTPAEEPIEHVSCVRLCPSTLMLALSNREGVVLLDLQTKSIVQCVSVSRLLALRAVHFAPDKDGITCCCCV